eukprot:TRINITY_DN18032_c0_g4_i1.p1 TRINITY_DN18032_c0_g4~~TRINITY_DN18032_c0_g4_i1.p1  ORF type:complete len:202 (+),score=19.03 TRINITY_DN18032_c0_g4_i1:385-990(+)
MSDDKTIFVRNVSDRVSPTNVREMFELCGKIEGFKKQWDIKACMFVYCIEFCKVASALAACALSGREVDGKDLIIEGSPMDKYGKNPMAALNMEDNLAVNATASPAEQLKALLRANDTSITHADGCSCPLCSKQEESKELITDPCNLCTSMLHFSKDCPILKETFRSDSDSCSSSYSSRDRKRKRRRERKGKKSRSSKRRR